MGTEICIRADLNALGREIAAEMKQKRERAYKPEPAALNLAAGRYPVSELDFAANVVNSDAEKFYVEHGARLCEPGAESGLKMAERRVMTTKHCLRYSYGQCPKQNSGPVFDWYLLDDKGHKYRLKFNCNECVMEIWF